MLLALSSTQKLVIALAAAAFVIFALVSSMVIPRSNPGFPGKHVGWFIALAVLFTVGMLSVVAFVAKESGEESAAEPTVTTPTETTTETSTTETSTPSTTTTTGGGTEGQGDPVKGKKVFLSAGCTGCHTLSDAGATGTVGPNLDDAKPPYDLVVERVTNGMSPMPPFKGVLTDQQIQDVAAYVSSVTRS